MVKRQSRYILPCGGALRKPSVASGGYGGMYNHLERGKGENVHWYYVRSLGERQVLELFLLVFDGFR